MTGLYLVIKIIDISFVVLLDGLETVVGHYSFHGDEQHGSDLNITDIQWPGSYLKSGNHQL